MIILRLFWSIVIRLRRGKGCRATSDATRTAHPEHEEREEQEGSAMRSDARANRQAIVDTARELLAARGVDVPLSAVATAAGTGIATLYRNFPTREDLVRAVLADLEAHTLDLVGRYRERSGADPADAWEDFVRGLAALRPGALVSVFAAQFVSDEGLAADVSVERSRALGAVEEILDRAKDAGLVRPDVTAARFQMGLASITRPLPDVAVPDVADHETWLVDLYLRGLRPDTHDTKD
jgi:AcrR family transcriptional regulator